MLARWHALLLLHLASWASLSLADPVRSFENTAIVRTVELGGSSTHVTTSYIVRSLEAGVPAYYFALSDEELSKTSWIEAKLKGGKDTLKVQRHSVHVDDRVALYSVTLPKPLAKNASTTILVNTIQTHASKPWPPMAKQSGKQSLLYETGLYVLSPYKSITQRTKFKLPTPVVHSFTTPSAPAKFTQGSEQSPVVQSGAAITYGPFQDIPPSAETMFVDEAQENISVHYQYDHPVLAVTSLKRSAEISHWGANLNIEDKIDLRNGGPALEGHFSRVLHQMQSSRNSVPASIVRNIQMYPPAGIRDPYFYDRIGNVSTSRFRPAISSLSKQSFLELRPRYPLVGGWNYSFTLGWDAPLGDSTTYDAKEDKYTVGVPFWTHIPNAVVDEAEVTIILPEGATDISIYPPFPPNSISRRTHTTYLDTTGRPSVTFVKYGLTEKHTGLIYVSYSVSTTAHMKKPIAVGAAAMGLFVVALIVRRINPKIHKGKKTA